jgi:hypothetical protein
MEKIDVKCRRFETAAGCDFGERCKFNHPKAVCEYFSKVGKCPVKECKDLHINDNDTFKKERSDCFFWLTGACKYSEQECNKGKHDQNKFGIHRRRETFLGQRQAEQVMAANHSQQLLVQQPIQPLMGGIQPQQVLVCGTQPPRPALRGPGQVQNVVNHQQAMRSGGLLAMGQGQQVVQGAGGGQQVHQQNLAGTVGERNHLVMGDPRMNTSFVQPQQRMGFGQMQQKEAVMGDQQQKDICQGQMDWNQSGTWANMWDSFVTINRGFQESQGGH